jgi:hypothetical protein
LNLLSPVSNEFSVKVGRLSAREWHELLVNFDDAAIYQTWSYGAVHWSPSQLEHFRLEQQGRVLAAAQLRILQLPIVRKGIAYIRGGPLCRLRGMTCYGDTAEQVIAALKDEYVTRRGLVLRIIPPLFQTDPLALRLTSIWPKLGFQTEVGSPLYHTVRLNLQPPLDQLRRNLGAKWRNKLNGAERNGLTINEGSDLHLYDRFLAAYRQMMARKQFETTVDVEEFRTIQASLPEACRMRTFLCEKEGQVLNALVVSAIGDTAIYLLGATSDEGLKLKGAYLLQWRAIQWLKERGCLWYDLGGINPEQNPGVYEFKSGFGGAEVSGLGTLGLSAGWSSDLCVRSAERLQASWQKVRVRFQRRATPSQNHSLKPALASPGQVQS